MWQVLGNLRLRYERDTIHTWVGHLLLVINPRKELPIYGTEQMENQLPRRLSELQRGRADMPSAGLQLGAVDACLGSRRPPHIFSIAESAYRNATAGFSQTQVIIVSGESGAGKTVSAHRSACIARMAGCSTTAVSRLIHSGHGQS